MTTPKGRGFRLRLKGDYEESAIADVVLIDPSAEFTLSGVEWARDDKVTLIML